jgi:hypothetical protein
METILKPVMLEKEFSSFVSTYLTLFIRSRPVVSPNRRMDNVMKDIQAVKIVNWKRCAQDGNKWK